MRPFAYSRYENVSDAIAAAAGGAKIIAGGTNLVDLMKLEVETPERVADISRLPFRSIQEMGEGLRIGALVSNSECAADLRIRRDYPVLAKAILAGASGQLRNAATTAGNLCQRTRCSYFTDLTQACNKRAPGSGCGAREGYNRMHAILGASDACIATYPGDMAVALSALDANIAIEGAHGTREVSARQFHRLPGDRPEKDNVLEVGEIITGVQLPAPIRGQHIYRKIRDRASYAFALISIATVVAMETGRIATAHVAFGGVAHKPWHVPAVDDVLTGAAPSRALFEKAADILLADARGYGHNDFKIALARQTLIAVLAEATGG